MTELLRPSEELKMLPLCQKLSSDKATTPQPSSLISLKCSSPTAFNLLSVNEHQTGRHLTLSALFFASSFFPQTHTCVTKKPLNRLRDVI